nr:YjjG family noncanonical pyrimidine nucleotidase [Macrococcus lamae]
MKYKNILFDIDNTLLDFEAAEASALNELFRLRGAELTVEKAAKYHEINSSLWKRHETEGLPVDDVVNSRFKLLFEAYGEEVDGRALEQQYRMFLNNGHDKIADAEVVLEKLDGRARLYVVTNGVKETQLKRMKEAGLDHYFKQFFISSEIGHQKPTAEFFEHAFERIDAFLPGDTLIIGDSLGADIKGGSQAGIDTCWFNPKGQKNTSDIVPTFEIRKLMEVLDIVC